MADFVQFKLEKTLEELEDLEKRGIFTRPELLEITKQRRKHFYRLKRPSPLKEDYLKFIEYESSLHKLKCLRAKGIARELKKSGSKKRLGKSGSDDAMVLRCLGVFRTACLRFKGDLDLWERYLEFCREFGHGRMKKVLAEVLGYHPKVPSLWIYAAAWELDHNSNVVAARALMQSGLRVCPNSEDLYIEYLRMELTVLNKLITRKVLLGEGKGSLIHDHKKAEEMQWREKNKDLLFMPIIEEKENADRPDNDDESENKVATLLEQGSIMFREFFRKAVKALPTSMSLRKRFVEILDGTNLAQELREEIMNDMKHDFAKDPEFWDWLARLTLNEGKTSKKITKDDSLLLFKKAAKVYEDALEVVPSEKMFSMYAKFWMDFLNPEDDGSQSSGFSNLSDHVADFMSNALKVYEKAESLGLMTEDLSCQYISLYLQLGRVEEARELAKKFCNEKLSGVVKIWVLRIQIEMKLIDKEDSSPSEDDLHSVFELCQEVLGNVSLSEAESLWMMAIKCFSNQKKYFKKLLHTFLKRLAGDSEGALSLSSIFLNLIVQKDGIQRARETYKRFLGTPRPSLALYKNCIELESNLAFSGDSESLVIARKLYEAALSSYSQDVELWQSYCSFEIKIGNAEKYITIYWRAKKTLKDTSELMFLREL